MRLMMFEECPFFQVRRSILPGQLCKMWFLSQSMSNMYNETPDSSTISAVLLTICNGCDVFLSFLKPNCIASIAWSIP